MNFINFFTYKKIVLFTVLILFLALYYVFFKMATYKELSYSTILGIQEIPKSDILYGEINKFQRENKLSAKKVHKIMSYLNIENSHLRYNFKGNFYMNMNVSIFPERYLIKNESIDANMYNFIMIADNKDILFKKNIPNICSIIVIGYSGKNIIYMNTFNSFGIYISKDFDDVRNKSMICKNKDDKDIKIKSINSIDISKEDFDLTNNLIDNINKLKIKNGLTTHQISSMIMSSDINFSSIKYKNIYDDDNIVVDKNNSIIYSKNYSKNKIKLSKNNFLVLYQDQYGKLGIIGEIDSINGDYIIAIKKEKATYIYDEYLSKLRSSVITD